MKFEHYLTLLFIGLKLSHQIDWSWWYIFSPMIFLIMLWLLTFILSVIVKTKEKLRRNKLRY
jgi:hypothetical protein